MKKILLVCVAALLVILPLTAMAASVTAVWQDGALTVTCGSDGFFQVLIDGADTGRWLGTGNYVYTWSIPADGREHTVTLYSLSYGTATATFLAGEAATPVPTEEPTAEPTEVPTQEPVAPVTEEPAAEPTQVPEVTTVPTDEVSLEPEEVIPPAPEQPSVPTARPVHEPVVTAVPAATAAAFSGKEVAYSPVEQLHDLTPAMGVTMEEALQQIGIDLQFSVTYGAKVVVLNVSELLGHDAIGSYRDLPIDSQLQVLASLLTDEPMLDLSDEAAAVLNAVRSRIAGLSGADQSAWNRLAEERFAMQPFTVDGKTYDAFSMDLRVTDNGITYERYTFYKTEEGWYLGALYTGVEK